MRALVIVAVLAGAAHAEDYDPYLLATPSRGAPRGRVRVEADASVGARSTRVFGDGSVEERIGVEVAPLGWLTVRVAVGQAVDGNGARQGAGVFSEVIAQVVRGRVDVRVGAGLTRDYLARVVPTARVAVGTRVGRFDLVAGAALDLHPDDSRFTREPVDVTVSAAVSTRVAAGAELGIELAGADLEGFVEDEEAEGGARLVAGPTLSLTPGGAISVRATAAAIVYATDNAPVAATAPAGGRVGFLGNLTIGYSFR